MSRPFEPRKNEGNQHELKKDTGDTAEYRCRKKRLKEIGLSLHTRNRPVDGAVDQSARDHGEEQRDVIKGKLFGEDSVAKTADHAVDGKLRRHKKAFGHGGHGKEDRAQRRRDQSDEKAPYGSADEATDEDGQMHGCQHSADFTDLTRQKRQQETKRKHHGGYDELFDLKTSDGRSTPLWQNYTSMIKL